MLNDSLEYRYKSGYCHFIKNKPKEKVSECFSVNECYNVSMHKVKNCQKGNHVDSYCKITMSPDCVVVVYFLGLMAFSYMSSLTQQVRDIQYNEDQMPCKDCSPKGSVWCTVIILVQSAGGQNVWKIGQRLCYLKLCHEMPRQCRQ